MDERGNALRLWRRMVAREDPLVIDTASILSGDDLAEQWKITEQMVGPQSYDAFLELRASERSYDAF